MSHIMWLIMRMRENMCFKYPKRDKYIIGISEEHIVYTKRKQEKISLFINLTYTYKESR